MRLSYLLQQWNGLAEPIPRGQSHKKHDPRRDYILFIEFVDFKKSNIHASWIYIALQHIKRMSKSIWKVIIRLKKINIKNNSPHGNLLLLLFGDMNT